MWMVECERHEQGLKKLRPLMPRPITLYGSHPTGFPAVTPRFTTGWNCTPAISSAPLVSTRWNPTPEQLQALEEIYRRGTRTPSAEQIQQIAAKLRRFGKIEGKNVFYWFQNHKARERQKKRRHEMELKLRRAQPVTQEERQSGMTKGDWEIGQPKKLSPPNCGTPLQYSESKVKDICQKERWAQLELHQHKQKGTTEFNCCQLDLASCLSPRTSNIAAQKLQENSNLFVTVMLPSKDDEKLEDENHQTLQLFPVHGSDSLGTLVSDDRNHPGTSDDNNNNNNHKLVPNQFFEFLLTKN